MKMSVDTLHKLCALSRLAAVAGMIPGHEMVITVDTVDVFGTKKTGEEIANEVRREALRRVFEMEGVR